VFGSLLVIPGRRQVSSTGHHVNEESFGAPTRCALVRRELLGLGPRFASSIILAEPAGISSPVHRVRSSIINRYSALLPPSRKPNLARQTQAAGARQLAFERIPPASYPPVPELSLVMRWALSTAWLFVLGLGTAAAATATPDYIQGLLERLLGEQKATGKKS
jgi:hypothetical protein